MSYDPNIRQKQEQYGAPMSANPISAQPVTVTTTTYAVGTVAAPPGQPMYAAYEGSAPTVTADATAIPRRQYPRGRWGDSICDWPLNLFPSCYCVCCFCCGIWLAAQIAQKTGYTNFQTPIWIFLVLCIIGFFLQIFIGAELILWIPMIFAFVFSLCLRIHIARKEGINECGSSPELGECCVGFWCWYCSVAQMARHVYGYNKVLDGDGDPYRPDNYLPIQQV